MGSPLYAVEVHAPEIVGDKNGGWTPIVTDSRSFCQGWFLARRDDGPRRAYRVVRCADGKVIEESAAREAPGLGMVAGWPTGAQMIRAAVRVLERVQEHGDYVSADEADRARRALEVLGA